MLKNAIWNVMHEYRPTGEIRELLDKAYQLAQKEYLAELEAVAERAEKRAYDLREDKTLTFEQWKQLQHDQAVAYYELMRKYEEEDCCETEDD